MKPLTSDQNNPTPIPDNNTTPNNNTKPNNNTTPNNTTPPNNNTNNNTTPNNDTPPSTGYTLPYPMYYAYADGVSTWWGDDFIAGLGVPGYAPTNPYNYFALSFWLSSGPVDLALVWS